MNKPALFILSALCLSISSAARADAQRLQITTRESTNGPDAEAIVHALLPDLQRTSQRVQVRLLNHNGASTLSIEVSGAQLPADAAAQLKAMFPALRDAQIVLTHGDATNAPPLPPEPAELNTPEQIAAYKAKLQAQLVAEGKTGTVEVTVTNVDGKRQVRVEVHADNK
jgi:hypothetical protein